MSLALVRIRLHGFKTFAQRTEVELTAPLTAIVGPNGCGKSNLVDAIVWALGEVNVRTLRAQTPTEVVFSGSSVHKPLGLAEVSLWFNNESRWLPIEADEVQITRRLYRSGEWECWINRTPARLRDVVELFAGTGLGRGGYAIVGQGDVEAFLNASPEERRQWLEEVAGIALYRSRRKDALRDLEAARLHLTRVDDVLRELDRQREPLRQQAERALVYRELTRQLQQLERESLRYDYSALLQRVQHLRAEREALRQQITATEQAIATTEAQLEAQGRAIAQLEAELDTRRSVLQSQLTAEERLLGELHRLDERKRALEELVHTLQEELHTLATQEAEHLARIQDLQSALQTAEAEAQSLIPAIQQLEAHATQLEHQRRAIENAYQTVLQQRAQYEHAQRQHEQLRHDAMLVEQRLHRLQAEVQALHDGLMQQRAHEDSLQAEAEALEALQRASEQTLQQLTREVQHHTRAVETLRTRIRALEASIQAGEGASPAVRALLQAVRRGELQGEYLPVGAALTVPEAYQQAIAAALGGAVNDILTPTEAEARRAIEWLQANRAGRLTFLPLDLLEPLSTAEPLSPEICAAYGVIGVATELVSYDSRFERAVQHLLGRVLVVDTLANATRLVRWLRAQARSNSFTRIATLDGSVVQLSGALTGGTSTHARNTLLQLRSDLERARAELQTAETQLHDAESRLEHHRTHHYAQQHQLENLRRRVREAAQHRLHLESELRQRTRDLQQCEVHLQRIQTQLDTLAAQLQTPPDANLEALEAERARLIQAQEAHTRELAQLQARASQLVERQHDLRRQLDAEQRALSHLRERQNARTTRLHTLQQEHALLQAQRHSLDAELERVRAQIAQLQADLEQRRAQRQTLLEQSFTLNEQVRALRATLRQYLERDRSIELQLARAEVKMQELSERWQQLAPDEPLPTTSEPLPEKPPVARAELERLRQAIAELGEVNLGAVDEYARLNERYTQLQRQRDDLERTCAQLEQNLREIDAHAHQRFLRTFEAVQQAFQQQFEQLFGGGRAELLLTDTRDPLSAGVIVEVQPPYKRRQRLELLSGGERALTALALLFAFNAVKPSPLLVLDEVDAALDGQNVQRFADYLKRVATQSQVLIVTHNPLTTAVAQQWLGVSMTGGVSRLVPYTPPESLRQEDGIERRRAVIQPASETMPHP
ncbi:MAG: chromosome segregation protein SMC [Fimbriimonadales bacterium]|nr:chromosome segregation protein SMC [Fimbriimonadales bacterium]